jgi:hypothetical protein
MVAVKVAPPLTDPMTKVPALVANELPGLNIAPPLTGPMIVRRS